MIHYIVAIILVLAISGCSTKVPPVSQYRLKTHPQEKKFMACDKSIKINKAFTNASFSSRKIYYGEGEHKQFAYTESQWSDALDRMISDIFTQSIAQSGVVKSVNSYKSQVKTDYILEIDIEEFMQTYDEKITSSQAEVRLTIALLDTKHKTHKASKTFEVTRDVKILNVENGVIALDEALGEVIDDMLVWLEEVCK